MLPVEVRDLRPDEVPFAAGVGARGMRDNPTATAVVGRNSLQRERVLTRTYRAIFNTHSNSPLVALRGGEIVGVAGMAPPGHCRVSLLETARLIVKVRPGPACLRRSLTWNSDWERRDPDEEHWHLGPVSVDAGLRGLGIGGQLMQRFTELMDEQSALAYLETDKPENVTFYERFGFETVDETILLGAHNWFMQRNPA